MADALTMFFVVRTDVSGGSGIQRSFGVFDDMESAVRECAMIGNHHIGDYAVVAGSEVVHRNTRTVSSVQYSDK